MSEGLRKALLLVGPTSSGKTPLGNLLEQQGLGGRGLRHFDFGAKFREAAAAEDPVPPLDYADLTVIRRAMETGALLTDGQFYIAHKILEHFLQDVEEGRLVVLNGMPRHEGQAKGITDLLDVVCVVELLCAQDTILERIRLDTGGDRAGRQDDLPALIAEKVKIYQQQTRPLLDYYQKKDVPVLTEPVTVVSTAPDIVGRIEPAFLKLEIR